MIGLAEDCRLLMLYINALFFNASAYCVTSCYDFDFQNFQKRKNFFKRHWPTFVYCWLKLDLQTNGFMLLQRADTLHLWTTKFLALLMCLALWVIFTISHIRFDYKISSNRRFIALLLSNMNWRRSRHDWWLPD